MIPPLYTKHYIFAKDCDEFAICLCTSYNPKVHIGSPYVRKKLICLKLVSFGIYASKLYGAGYLWYSVYIDC